MAELSQGFNEEDVSTETETGPAPGAASPRLQAAAPPAAIRPLRRAGPLD
jgi:hypothetical protein